MASLRAVRSRNAWSSAAHSRYSRSSASSSPLDASAPARDAAVNRLFDRTHKTHDGVITVEEGQPSGLDRTPQQRAEGVGL